MGLISHTTARASSRVLKRLPRSHPYFILPQKGGSFVRHPLLVSESSAFSRSLYIEKVGTADQIIRVTLGIVLITILVIYWFNHGP